MVSLRALFLLLASGLLLAACAPSPIVQLYPGTQQPDSQVLTVRIPSQLQVFSINGKKVSGINTFFSTGHKDLKLTPGRYEIVAWYKELWNLSPDEHTILESDPVTFVVDGKAGELYKLGYPHPENAHQARALANNFSGWVENLSTGEKTPTQGSGLVLERGILASLTGPDVVRADDNSVTPQAQDTVAPQGVEPVPAAPPTPTPMPMPSTATPRVAPQTGVDAKTTDAAPAQSGSYLQMLKAQWTQATPEERRAFLKWIAR